MKKIKLITSSKQTPRKKMILDGMQDIAEFEVVLGDTKIQNSKILLLISLDKVGEDAVVTDIIRGLQQLGNDALEGSVVMLIVSSSNLLFTKEYTKKIVYLLNEMGAVILGQPLVEGLGNLENLRKWALKLDLSSDDTLIHLSREALVRLLNYTPQYIEKPKLLVLHANSNEKTSNTHLFWKEVEKKIEVEYEVIHVEDGTVMDCHGCTFDTCGYFAQQNSCFYGGIMVKEILPAIEKADAVLWLVPNYNDSVSAKLMAVINRLTVLYRKHPLFKKNIFAIVVSGNSGSDSVIGQLISALNINKGFRLPPYFSTHAIANSPQEILELERLDILVNDMVEVINRETHYI